MPYFIRQLHSPTVEQTTNVIPQLHNLWLQGSWMTYRIRGAFGADFNLAVILIWRFGDFGFDGKI